MRYGALASRVLTPPPLAHAPPPPNASQGRKNREGPEGTGHGERDEQGEITGQGRPPSPKMVQSAEGGEGKDKRGRIIVGVKSPCQENYPADAHPSAHKPVLELANPAWTRSVHLDAPGQWHGQQPVSRTANPGVVKQDKSSRGSVDTTKTCSDPQGVRMSCSERPICAAKGKQPNTEALCQPPPSGTSNACVEATLGVSSVNFCTLKLHFSASKRKHLEYHSSQSHTARDKVEINGNFDKWMAQEYYGTQTSSKG